MDGESRRRLECVINRALDIAREERLRWGREIARESVRVQSSHDNYTFFGAVHDVTLALSHIVGSFESVDEVVAAARVYDHANKLDGDLRDAYLRFVEGIRAAYERKAPIVLFVSAPLSKTTGLE